MGKKNRNKNKGPHQRKGFDDHKTVSTLITETIVKLTRHPFKDGWISSHWYSRNYINNW